MAYSTSTVVIKDGNGTAIPGAVNEIDTSGSGAGPWKFSQAIIDGAGLANAATTGASVKAANQQAVGGDQALVVAISPNGQLAAGQANSNASAPVVGALDWKEVVGITTQIALAVPGTTTSAYTANQEVGTLMTFAATARTPNNAGVLQYVFMTGKSAQTTEFDLYLFNSNPSNTSWTDHSTAAINAADVNKLLKIVKFTKQYSGLGTHTLYEPDLTTFTPVPFSGTTLYGILVTPGTPTLVASDLTINLCILQD